MRETKPLQEGKEKEGLHVDARLTANEALQEAHAILQQTLRETSDPLIGTPLSDEEHETVSRHLYPGRCSSGPSTHVADVSLVSSLRKEEVHIHAKAMRRLEHIPERARRRTTGQKPDVQGSVEVDGWIWKGLLP